MMNAMSFHQESVTYCMNERTAGADDRQKEVACLLGQSSRRDEVEETQDEKQWSIIQMRKEQ